MIEIKVKTNYKQFKNQLKKQDKHVEKSLQRTLKIVGYKYHKKLKEEIRAEAPGGQDFKKRTIISKHISGRRKTLSTLATSVRYDYERLPNPKVEIGWVGRKVSKRNKILALAHQEGFSRPVTQKIREHFAAIGGNVRGQKKRVFFLRKDTERLETEPRPIIQPFWYKHKTDIRTSIDNVFDAKIHNRQVP